MVAGDGCPRETAGMSAGPTADHSYRASSLPYHHPEDNFSSNNQEESDFSQ